MSEPEPGTSWASSALTFPSPKKKRPKRGPLSSTEKQIVINVFKFKYIEETWPKDVYPYKKEIIKKTATLLGICEPTLYRVIKEYTNSHELKSPPLPATKPRIIDSFDDMDLSAIRRKIHMFFFDNEIPTIDKVLESVNNDDSLPNLKRSMMSNLMKKLGFKYSKRNRKSMLIDKPEIAVWRVKYLNEISKYRRDGKKIYYLDETWVNEGHTKSSTWQDSTITSCKEAHRQGLSTGLKNPSGKGKRLILGHIGSSSGFVEGGELIFEAKKGDGDYHSEMYSHNFEKWITTVLKKLDKNSILVMDNASYHSRRIEKIPTTATRKADIQKWLTDKNIAFEATEIKAELLQKVKYEKHKYQLYAVDELAKENVTVLRLPPYHCELNPIELIWAQVKGFIADKNKTFKMADLKMLLPEALASVTMDNWKNCEDHVIKEEQKMFNLDKIIDETTERFIIHVTDSSTSPSDSE